MDPTDNSAQEPIEPEVTPPKSLQRQVRSRVFDVERFPSDGSGKALGRRRTGALGRRSEPLPVLEAFQDFLEAERRKTQKRMVALTLFFVAVAIFITAIAVSLGMILFGRVKSDFVQLQGVVASDRQRAAVALTNTQQTLYRFREESSELRGQLAAEAARVAEVKTDLAVRSAASQSNFESLRTQLSSLQEQNALLHETLDRVEMGLPMLSGDVSAALNEIARLRGALRESPIPAFGPMHNDTLTLSVSPPGSESALAWRMPIP